MEALEKRLNAICKFFDQIAKLSVFLMMVLVAADVIFRKPLRSIPGMYDYISFLGAMIIAFALPHSAVLKGNIQVEMFVERLPKRVQGVIDTITGLLSLAFFLLASWQSLVFGNDMRASGEVSMTTHLPYYPLLYIISLMLFLVCLVIVIEIIKSTAKVVKR